jgi:hypothetical protein
MTCPSDAPQGRVCKSSTTRPPSPRRENQVRRAAEFNRADGPADAIAHGYLTGGPVALFGADVAGDERPLRCEGLMLALLGTADPAKVCS